MSEDKLKIGVLFSQSGPMSVTEAAHIKGVLVACDEINQNGGIRQKLIEPIIVNPEGKDERYAQLATELLLKHHVNAIFGCCLSSSRKSVLPVIERFNGLLFYPSVYEGFEYSPNVIYGGAIPNQVVLPLLEYVFAHYGKNIALVGSDTFYAREVNRIVKEFLDDSEGYISEEVYFSFGTREEQFVSLLSRLADKKIDAIISTVVGNDSVTFYNSLVHAGLSSKELPIASLTTTESELEKVTPSARDGHLTVSSYFASIEHEENKYFIKKFGALYETGARPCVYSAVCYSQVHLFANALQQCEEFGTDAILAALYRTVSKSPGGNISLDVDTNHLAVYPLIGQSNTKGDFRVLWRSKNAITPDPYLVSYDRSVSEQMVL